MGKNILIIEDDAVLQNAYQTALTQHGYEVTLASTGNDGLQKAKVGNPHLIILDLMLTEEMNGFDVLEQLKSDEDLVKIPVFVLTNLDNKENTVTKIGADKCFIKANISIDGVIEEINSALS